MAESGSRPAVAPAKCVKLRIIHQQSSEGVGALQYDNLPVSTSIRELKAKIHDSLPNHPSIDSQRLIYRGRVMATETAPLEDILGGDSIRQHDTYTFHLVVRDLNPSTNHSSAPTQQPNVQGPQSRTPLPPNVIAQNIFSQLHPRSVPPGPNQQPFPPPNQTGAAGIPQVRGNPLGGPQSIPAPPIFPQTQINGPQILHQSPFLSPQAIHHGHSAATPPFPMPMIPPEIAQAHQQMQQHVAAAMQQFMPPSNPPNGQSQQNQTQEQHPLPAQTNAHTPSSNNESAADPQTQTFTRELSSNGSRISMRVNTHFTPLAPRSQTQSPFNSNQTTQQRSEQPSNPTQPQLVHGAGINSIAGFPGQQPPQIWNSAPTVNPPPPNDRRFLLPTATLSIAARAMRAYQEDLERLGRDVRGRSAMNAGSNEGLMFSMALRGMVRHRNVVQESVNHILAAGQDVTGESLQPAEVAELERLSEQFALQHASITRTIDSMSQRAPAGSSAQEGQPTRTISEQASLAEPLEVTRQAALASTSQSPSVPSQAAEHVTAYLVFSPSGPHSIVYSPQGAYATTPQPPTLAFNPLNGLSSQLPPLFPANPNLFPQQHVPPAPPNNASFHQHAASRPQSQPQLAAAAADAAQQQQLLQAQQQAQQAALANAPNPQQQQQQQQQEGDGLVVVAPLFRTLWLFIRLAGFIWLFTSGSVSYRSILLLALGAAIWAVQHGVFGNRFDGIQRYWDNLIGVPRPEQQPQPQPQPEAEQNPPPAQGQEQQAQQRDAAPQNDAAPHRRRPGHVPTPQQAAQRLLDARREHDRNWWRERLRPLERIVALFLASLYPGVGERRVAEVEQLRAEREAAERRLRLEREQNGQGEDGNPQSAQTSSSDVPAAAAGSAQRDGAAAAAAAASSSDADAATGTSSAVSLADGAEPRRLARYQSAAGASVGRRRAGTEEEEAWEDVD